MVWYLSSSDPTTNTFIFRRSLPQASSGARWLWRWTSLHISAYFMSSSYVSHGFRFHFNEIEDPILPGQPMCSLCKEFWKFTKQSYIESNKHSSQSPTLWLGQAVCSVEEPKEIYGWWRPTVCVHYLVYTIWDYTKWHCSPYAVDFCDYALSVIDLTEHTFTAKFPACQGIPTRRWDGWRSSKCVLTG